MPPEIDETQTLVGFLLDELDEQERSSIERRLFQDDRLFDAVNSVEEDLVQDYLLGKLPPERRRPFENKYFSTPALTMRVDQARQVLIALGALPQRAASKALVPVTVLPRRLYRRRLAVAACLLLTGNLGVELWRLRSLGDRRDEAVVASFILQRGEIRGPSTITRRLRMPRSGAVELQLDILPVPSAGEYWARVATPEGLEIWSGALGPVSGNTVPLRIPAKLLDRGDYLVTLERRTAAGSATVEEYSFSSAGYR